MKLVICEKNIAARRISYILSGGKLKSTKLGKTPVYEFTKDGDVWKVVGLRGHIINLDFPAEYNRWNNIQPSDLIEVKPCKKITEKSIAASLKSLVDKNPYLIVATDYDREGELIGVEVVDLIKNYNKLIPMTLCISISRSIISYELNFIFKICVICKICRLIILIFNHNVPHHFCSMSCFPVF